MKYISDIDIADAYIENRLQGIYDTQDVSYFPIRITGLGITKRLDEEATKRALLDVLQKNKIPFDDNMPLAKISELVNNNNMNASNYAVYTTTERSREQFANPKALEAYAGLPITLDHPTDSNGEKTLLNSATIQQTPIVGSIIKAYERDGSVWGVAKIYDKRVFKHLDAYPSTSPGFEVCGIMQNEIATEYPNRFNHLAFVEKGYWDASAGERAMDLSCVTFDRTIDSEGANMAKEEVKENEKVEEQVDSEAEAVETEKVDSEAEAVEAEKAEEQVDSEAEVVANDPEAAPTPAAEVDNAEESQEISNIGGNMPKKEKVDSITEQVATPEANEAKVDEEVGVIDEQDEIIEAEHCDEYNEEIEGHEEIDEDREREELIDSFRSVIDKSDVKLSMPYIQGRKKVSAVLGEILLSNFRYVDSKYDDVILNNIRKPAQNKQLLVDAYNSMLGNIEKENKKINSKVRGFQKTSNPNIRVDKEF